MDRRGRGSKIKCTNVNKVHHTQKRREGNSMARCKYFKYEYIALHSSLSPSAPTPLPRSIVILFS